jgi:hypothetical protein
MSCYLEDYRARVGTWAARTSWATKTTWCTSQGNARLIFCLEIMILCATTLAVLLVIGRVEKNPGLVWRLRKFCKFCTASATEILNRKQCNTCGRWFHNSCGNVNAQVAESGKWTCDKCRSERLRLLEEKLQNALLQIDELTRTRHWKNSYYWQLLEGKLARGIRCR